MTGDALADAIRRAERDLLEGADAAGTAPDGARSLPAVPDTVLMAVVARDPRTAGSVCYLAALYTSLGRRDDARHLLRRAADALLLGPPPDAVPWAEAVNRVGAMSASLGDLGTAHDLLRRGAEETAGPLPPVHRARVHANLAAVQVQRGSAEAAQRSARRARECLGAVPEGARGDDARERRDIEALLAMVAVAVMRDRGEPASRAQALADFRRTSLGSLAALGAGVDAGTESREISLLTGRAVIEFEQASSLRRTEDMERLTLALEAIAVRASATLGAEHPQTVAALVHLARAEYASARAENPPRPARVERAGAALRTASDLAARCLGAGHPLAAGAPAPPARAAGRPGGNEAPAAPEVPAHPAIPAPPAPPVSPTAPVIRPAPPRHRRAVPTPSPQTPSPQTPSPPTPPPGRPPRRTPARPWGRPSGRGRPRAQKRRTWVRTPLAGPVLAMPSVTPVPLIKPLTAVLIGQVAYFLTKDAGRPSQWTLAASLLIGCGVLLVLYLVEFARRLRQLRTNLFARRLPTAPGGKDAPADLDNGVRLVSAVEAGAPRPDAMVELARNGTRVRAQGPPILQDLAMEEIGRLVRVFEALATTGVAESPEEHPGWLPTLTRCAGSAVDAVSFGESPECWNTRRASELRNAEDQAVRERGVRIRRLYVVGGPEEADAFAALCAGRRERGVEALVVTAARLPLSARRDWLDDFVLFDGALSYEPQPAHAHGRHGLTRLETRTDRVARRAQHFEALWNAAVERCQRPLS